MKVDVKLADYSDPKHANAIGYLMDSYAKDPMGGSTPLPEDVKRNLARALSKIPHAFTVLCYADNQPAGLINCFEGFSTFKCKPLINIHDVVVVDAFRGQGLSRIMLSKVEDVARESGCCKMTLEVLDGNIAAKSAYLGFGFEGYELDPAMGKALFWQKHL